MTPVYLKLTVKEWDGDCGKEGESARGRRAARHIGQASGIVFAPNTSVLLGVELSFCLYGFGCFGLLTRCALTMILYERSTVELSRYL